LAAKVCQEKALAYTHLLQT